MNTKPAFEVWSELKEHMSIIQILGNSTTGIHAAIQDVHLVDLIDIKETLKKNLKNCTCGQCHQKITFGREGQRYVLIYRPMPGAKINIYSNPIILN